MFDRSFPYDASMVPAPRRAGWRAMAETVVRAVGVILTRRNLTELEPRLLADIGLTRAEALAEAARKPWDLQPPGDLQPRRRQPAGGQRSPTTLHRVRRVLRRWQSRRQIASLDTRVLKDIGVTYTEAEVEANKPFWRE